MRKQVRLKQRRGTMKRWGTPNVKQNREKNNETFGVNLHTRAPPINIAINIAVHINIA